MSTSPEAAVSVNTNPGWKQSAARGVAWKSAATWGAQILNFGVYTGLARLLNPNAFGLVAIAWVFIGFSQVFVRQGLGDAIIQRRELEPEHLDSALWIALATSFVFCFASIVLANPISHIFRVPRVAPVIRWLSPLFVFIALSAVPTAILTRELNFRPLAIRSLVSVGVGGTVGLAMAYSGWGVWSLVGQQLTAAILSCITLWLAVPWRPGFRMSKRHLRDLYRFSLNLTANDILWFYVSQSDEGLVGYGFGPAGLGPYSLANRLNTVLNEAVLGPLQSVAFPLFSKLQSEPLRLERALQQFCELCSFVSFPVFGGLIVVAPQLVPFLFGAKWSSAIPLLQVLAVYGALRAALAFVHPIMLAKGRTGFYLLLFVLQSALTLTGCLVAVRWSPRAIALSMVVTMFLFGTIELILVSAKVVRVRPIGLMKKFAFPILATAFMMVVVSVYRGLVRNEFNTATTLFSCILAGMVAYTATAILLRPDLVKTIWESLASCFARTVSGPDTKGHDVRVGYATNAAPNSSGLD